MKKIITLLCAALCANVLWAQTTFTVGNLIYTVIDFNSVKVSGCSDSATSLVIPPTVTDNNSITYNVTSIESYAFLYNNRLNSVTLPNSITYIGEFSFYWCTNLDSIVIPNSVTTIDDYAFSGCSSLRSLVISNSVTTIDESAFHGCTSLSTVTIPNSVTTIGFWAFKDVKHIIYHGTASGSPWGAWNMNGFVENEFIYNDSTKTTLIGYMGDNTNVVIPNGVITIERAFYKNTNITSVIIPNSVTTIGNNTFYSCSNLTSIIIPNSVTSIGEYTFYGSGLTSIILSDSLTSIGKNVFS